MFNSKAREIKNLMNLEILLSAAKNNGLIPTSAAQRIFAQHLNKTSLKEVKKNVS